MKILNLYAGIGGNRKLWGDEHEITAIENNEEIAAIYKKNFPNDEVIVADAHKYLLEHIKEFDFIWSSPPCPTHSRLKIAGVSTKVHTQKIIYPDMKLYQEIILLKYFTNKSTKWVVENVTPYYDSLIKPSVILGRHYIWTNFYVRNKIFSDNEESVAYVHIEKGRYNFSVKRQDLKTMNGHPEKVLANLVNPEIGKYLFEQSQKGLKPLFNFNY